MLEFIALGSDPERGRSVASALGGIAYGATAEDPSALPFGSLIRVSTEDLDALRPAADLGLYLAYGRRMRRESVSPDGEGRVRGVVAVFGLHRKSGLSHREADAHWRDIHAPLACVHHPGMCDYHQASVVRVFEGVPYDGFAFCKFATEEDLRERFFDSDEGRDIILADVAKFADLKRSPRVVHSSHYDFEEIAEPSPS